MASILLIDDDDDVRPTITRLHVLARGGHDIRQAENGVEGMEMYLPQARPILVLTDLVMPEKGRSSPPFSSYDHFNPTVKDHRHVRRLPPTTLFKLYLHMATRFGADRVLRKPFQSSRNFWKPSKRPSEAPPPSRDPARILNGGPTARRGG